MTEAKVGPSKALAGIAASLPVLFVLLSCCVLPLVARGDYDQAERMIEETGFWFWIVLGCAALSAVVTALLVFLAARGARVPAAVTVFVAGIPWLAGLAGTAWGMNMVDQAVAFADPGMRATLMAQGISEASNARIIGAWTSAALLSAVGIGLALGAVGQRAPDRKGIGALVGIASALPMLAIAAWVTVAMGPSGVTLVLPGLAIVVAAGLAAAGAGRDEPHRRSAALAAAAPLAVGLAFVATAMAVHAGYLMQCFAALASAGGGSRGELMAAMAADLVPAQLAQTWGAVAAVVPVIGVGGWALLRGGASAGRIAGAVAAVLVAAIFPGSNGAISAYTTQAIAGAGTPSWDGVADFHPAVIASTQGCTARLLVSPAGAALIGQPAVPLSDAAGVSRVLSQALAEGSEDYGADPGARALHVALDARVGAADLSRFADAAREAGATELCVEGASDESITPEQRALIERNAPVFAPFAQSYGSVRLRFPDREPRLIDPVAYRGEVGASGPVTLTARSGTGAQPITLSPSPDPFAYHDMAGSGQRAYLALSPDATAASLLAAADAAAQRDIGVILVTDRMAPVPGEPAGTAPGTPDPAAGILGLLGQIGNGTRAGSPTVTGTLSRDAIQSVVRAHANEVRRCYEQELARDPSLVGRVEIEIVIGPTGEVQEASTQAEGVPTTVASCIGAAARTWRFPAPEGGGVVRVRYPFVLSPSP